MVRGIHTAAAGMMAQAAAQDITANNLANADTAGYKRDVAGFRAALADAIGAPGAGDPVAAQTVSDFRQGTIRQTGDRFHLALDGDGFFTVQTPNGPAYTRDGAFTRAADGYLVTRGGNRVLGTNGPIRLNEGDWAVSATGEVTQGGRGVGTLRLARFAGEAALSKAGNNLWRSAAAPQNAPDARVRQGCLEGSNVNTISEMVTMITGFRVYEAGQKAIQAQDQTLDRLVNEVGRVG